MGTFANAQEGALVKYVRVLAGVKASCGACRSKETGVWEVGHFGSVSGRGVEMEIYERDKIRGQTVCSQRFPGGLRGAGRSSA